MRKKASPTTTSTRPAIRRRRLRDRLAQDQVLKTEQQGADREDIAAGVEQGAEQTVDHGRRLPGFISPLPSARMPKRTIPKSMTKIIGVNDASAIIPKPSMSGSRPRIEVASPTPSAVTSGTVTVEVVTPPESKAMPTMASGAMKVIADDDDVAADDQVLNRPAAEDAENADDDRRPDRQRDGQSKLEGVGRLGRGVGRDIAGVGRDRSRLAGDGDEGRFGDGGRKAEQETEDQQPDQAALAGEGIRHGLADGEETHLQPLHEEHQSEHDEERPDQDLRDIGKGLAQHQGLEADDHDDDRQQIPHRIPEPASQHPHQRRREFESSMHAWRATPSAGDRRRSIRTPAREGIRIRIDLSPKCPRRSRFPSFFFRTEATGFCAEERGSGDPEGPPDHI